MPFDLVCRVSPSSLINICYDIYMVVCTKMIDERCASPLLAHTLTIKDQLRFVSAAPLRSKMSNGINELLSRRRYHFFVFLMA